MGAYDTLPASLVAGQTFTGAAAQDMLLLLQAAGTNGGLWSAEYVFKPSDTTRSSTTTLSADPDLTFTLQPNSTTLVEFHLKMAAITAEGFKSDWTTPADAVGSRSVIGPGSSASDSAAANDSMRTGVHNFNSAIGYGTRNDASNQVYLAERAIVITVTGGTCAIRWAQLTSGGTGTTVGARSWGVATRLA